MHITVVGQEDFVVLKLYMIIYTEHLKLSIGYVPALSSVSEVNDGDIMNHWSYACEIWYGARSYTYTVYTRYLGRIICTSVIKQMATMGNFGAIFYKSNTYRICTYNNSIQFNSSLLMCRINSQKANYTNSTTYRHK
jgi:hypothetical protein